MKIAVVGNLCQNGYIIVKTLRKLGFDADLFVTCKNGFIASTQDPREYDKMDEFPKWIKTLETAEPFLFLKTAVSIRFRYDVVIALTTSPAYMQFFSKRLLCIATGSDLREHIYAQSLDARLLKCAYQKCEKIFFLNPDHLDSIRNHGWMQKAVFLPYLMEIEHFETAKPPLTDGPLELFWPSSWSIRLKGIDSFLSACSKLFDQGYDVKLKIIDNSQGSGDQRSDTTEILDFAKKYQQHIKLIPRIKERRKLMEEYAKADIVIDQFLLGSYGAISSEAMCTHTPAMTYLSEKYASLFKQDEPPFINCHGSEQIYRSLTKYADNSQGRHNLRALGEQSFAWVKRNHQAETVVKIITNVL